MSDVVLVALITGVVGVAGIASGMWNSQQERKQRLREFALNRDERYREGLYQKLLQAHNDAYGRVSQLGRIVSPAGPTPNVVDPGDDIVDTVRSLHSWLDENALYLDPVSSEAIVRYIGICLEWASRGDSSPLPYEHTREVLAVIAAGTGLKHFDTEFTKKILDSWRGSGGDA